MKVKRRLDFTATAQELANNLSSADTMAALMMQNLTAGSSNPLAQKAMDAYVSSKCPSIKYKQLFLPEHGGSLDKARRHFAELRSSPDALVAALAWER